MQIYRYFVVYQVFHLGEGALLAWLVDEHHQHYPFELLYANLQRVQCQCTINNQFAVGRVQNIGVFEKQQQPAAIRVQSTLLFICVNPDRTAGWESF